MDRLVIVPDEKLEPLVLSLKARLSAIVGEVRAENIADVIGEDTRLLPTLAQGGAGQELLLWARSARAFLAAWTSRPFDAIAGVATADLDVGLISQVFASGKSVLQAGAEVQANQWTNLEETRGQVIDGMAASPVFIFGKCAAALALAAYRGEGNSSAVTHEGLARLAEAASVVGRLLEDRLLRATLGFELL